VVASGMRVQGYNKYLRACVLVCLCINIFSVAQREEREGGREEGREGGKEGGRGREGKGGGRRGRGRERDLVALYEDTEKAGQGAHTRPSPKVPFRHSH
jgi:hypothetical protein